MKIVDHPPSPLSNESPCNVFRPNSIFDQDSKQFKQFNNTLDRFRIFQEELKTAVRRKIGNPKLKNFPSRILFSLRKRRLGFQSQVKFDLIVSSRRIRWNFTVKWKSGKLYYYFQFEYHGSANPFSIYMYMYKAGWKIWILPWTRYIWLIINGRRDSVIVFLFVHDFRVRRCLID